MYRKILRTAVVCAVGFLLCSCSADKSGSESQTEEVSDNVVEEIQTEAQSEYEVMTEIPVNAEMLDEQEKAGEVETIAPKKSGGVEGSATSEKIEDVEFEVFSNDGIEILRPKDWENNEFSDTTACFARYEDSGFVDNFVIAAVTNDIEDKDLEEYSKELEINFTKSGYNSEKTEITQINGYDAVRMVFTGNQDEYTLKGTQVFIPVDEQIYIINFIATKNQYDGLEPIIDKMIESFKF